MATYLIREENMERLEKKLASIEKKCRAAKCSFNFEVKDEDIFRKVEDEDGFEHVYKFKEVEVSGTAKYNGWEFVAVLDHHDNGNVIRAYNTELVIPDRYKNCGPTCEHCNKIRSRKDTYLIYNEESQEFKQVGKSCLQEYTSGLSSEDVAFFCSVYKQVENLGSYSGSSFTRYINVEDILRYAFECYRHWGYQKSVNSFYEEEVPRGYRSTSSRVQEYYSIDQYPSKVKKELQKEMDAVGFNPSSSYAVETTKSALDWIRNEEELSNEYIRNLHVVCSDEYTDHRSIGILVSLTTAYNRHIGKLAAYERKQKVQEIEKAESTHIGEIGSRISVKTSNFALVSSWEGIYGMTFLYKFTDADGNICIWYASKPVDNEESVIGVTGTVKDHSEYNDVKQTVLTRCKVTLGEELEHEAESADKNTSSSVEEALNTFFEAVG